MQEYLTSNEWMFILQAHAMMIQTNPFIEREFVRQDNASWSRKCSWALKLTVKGSEQYFKHKYSLFATFKGKELMLDYGGFYNKYVNDQQVLEEYQAEINSTKRKQRNKYNLGRML